MNPVIVYNCCMASLTSLTVNGSEALTQPLQPFSTTSPGVSFVTLSTKIFVPSSSVSAYFSNSAQPAWNVTLPFEQNLPVVSYSLWCYFNGLFLCNTNGVITSTFFQKNFSALVEDPSDP